MSVFWDFAYAATVMAAWVGIAFILAFIGVFLMNLIGDWIYGRNSNRRN